MYIASLKKAGEAIRIAEQRLEEGDKGGKKGVEELMRDSADTIGPYLGTTVRSVKELWMTADNVAR